MAYNYSDIYPFIAYSTAIGILLGVIYDFFRIIRMAFILKSKGERSGFLINCVVFICDVTFFIISAVICAIFIFYVNNGRIRGIAIFGSLIGFIAYYNTVGRLVTSVSGALIRGICYILTFTANNVLMPVIRGIFKSLTYIVKRISDFINYIYTVRQTVRIIKRFKKKGC